MDLEGEIARARAANEQRAADESMVAESKARAATDAERHLRGLLSEAAELLRSRGVAPDVATVRGSGTVLQRFTVRERAWRLDSQWGLTEGGRLARLTTQRRSETTSGGVWSSGQPIKDAIRYNRRLRRFLDQEGLSEAAWFEEEPSVTVPELSAGPWYSITTTGWRFFVVEGAIYFASCHEESMTFDHAPTLEQWLAARLADLGV